MHAYVYTCTSLYLSTHAHTGLSTCAHIGVLRSFFLLQWEWSAVAGFLLPYFILCAVIPMADSFLIYFLFPFHFPGHFLATQRHLRGCLRHTMWTPWDAAQHTQHAAHPACGLLRPYVNLQCPHIIIIAHWNPSLCTCFHPYLWTFMNFYWKEMVFSVFLLIMFWIIFREERNRRSFVLPSFPRILSKGLKGGCSGSEKDNDVRLKVVGDRKSEFKTWEVKCSMMMCSNRL